jgi:hypothetical protein
VRLEKSAALAGVVYTNELTVTDAAALHVGLVAREPESERACPLGRVLINRDRSQRLVNVRLSPRSGHIDQAHP